MISTLILSHYGPISYVNYDSVIVIAYVLIFLILFSLAYFYGSRKRVRHKIRPYGDKSYSIALSVVKYALSISVVYYIGLLIYFLLSGGSFDISKAGESYVALYDGHERGSGSYSLQFLSSIVIHPFYLVSVILGSYYYKVLNRRYRYMLILIVLIELLVNGMGYGKMKYIGDLAVFITIALVIRIYSQKVNNKIPKKVFLIMTFSIAIMVYLLHLRYQAIGISFDNIDLKQHFLMKYETEGLLSNFEFGFAIAALSQYLTQGWYGLSLALQLPFEWTFGFGNSYSLMIIYDRFLFGEDLLHLSYPYRVADFFGWGANQDKWYSWFTWFASDFSFIGVIFLAIPMGYIYAISWRESIVYSNPISIFFFSLQSLGLIFLPANNQLLHTPNGVLVFFIAAFLWIFVRRYFSFKNE